MTEDFRKPPVRFVDVSSLPKDLVRVIDDLKQGEHLTLVRGGTTVARIVSAGDVLDGVVIERGPDPEAAQTSAGRPPHSHGKATVVASALNLSGYARGLLSEELGEDYIVLDFAAAPSTADVLIVGPISRHLVARLSLRFPNARVMIIEVGDEQLGIDSEGPVRRLLDAGAETYLVSSTIPNLAVQLDQAITRPALTSGARPQVEIENVTTFLGETDSSDW